MLMWTIIARFVLQYENPIHGIKSRHARKMCLDFIARLNTSIRLSFSDLKFKVQLLNMNMRKYDVITSERLKYIMHNYLLSIGIMISIVS